MLVKNYRPAGVGMLPAQPCTYLLHAYFDGDQLDLVKANVVGWQISPERGLTPLVIDPRAADSDPWFVCHPDGRVECSDGRCWDEIETWIKEERRLQRAARELALGRLRPEVQDVVQPDGDSRAQQQAEQR